MADDKFDSPRFQLLGLVAGGTTEGAVDVVEVHSPVNSLTFVQVSPAQMKPRTQPSTLNSWDEIKLTLAL